MEANDYCSYELSIALKKAGLNEPCDSYYCATMIFIIGKGSYIQADDVAYHQNDIGKDNKDRRIICLGEDSEYEGCENLRPIRYLAVAQTIEIINDIKSEFESEVEIYFGTEEVAESYSSLKCK